LDPPFQRERERVIIRNDTRGFQGGGSCPAALSLIYIVSYSPQTLKSSPDNKIEMVKKGIDITIPNFESNATDEIIQVF